MPGLTERAPEIKRAAAALAPVSEAGVFEGYASLFDIVDTANDQVMRGAFAQSLQKRGARGVKMLWQHQSSEPIGTWLSIEEDARGLKVRGRLNLAVARAREVLALMREGAVDGLSIGFRTERASLDRKSGVRKLHRLDLWEISIVTFPALPQARISAVNDFRARRNEPAPATLDAICMKLARLRTYEAASNFEVKLQRLARHLETRYSPDQPRAPAGSPEGGQWTSGGGSASSTGSGPSDLQRIVGAVVSALDPISSEVSELPQAIQELVAQSAGYCRRIKNLCIAECSDTALPTSDFGASFFKCVNACLERYGCLGKI